MFWMKKLVATLATAVLVAGGLLAGLAMKADGVAHATAPLAGENAAPDDLDEAAKRLEKRLADLEKQKELLDATLADLQTEKKKLDEAKKAKAQAEAAAELGKDIAVDVGSVDSAYTVREVVNGKVAVVTCSNLDVLATYLGRAFNDPNGPKRIRVSAYKDHPADHLNRVFAACATAGYAKAVFSQTDRLTYRVVTRMVTQTVPYTVLTRKPEVAPKPGEIDLTKYAPKKRP